jgi:hypothetical protein
MEYDFKLFANVQSNSEAYAAGLTSQNNGMRGLLSVIEGLRQSSGC